MSEELFSCGYGAILACDKEVLEACLAGAALTLPPAARPVAVCEIGMHDGGTAGGMEHFLAKRGFPLEYYGVDPDDGSTRPRYIPKGGKVIVGDSSEVFHQIPDELDLVWVDGCHCALHALADAAFYLPKVRIGGFACFHDTNPRGQMLTTAGHQYHGPEGIPEFAIAVRHGLELIHFPWPNWELVMDETPTDLDRIDCGTMAFRRLA